MRWTGRQMTRLRKEKRTSLKREEERNYKMILNALIVVNRGIILGIATRNRNKTEKLGQKSKSQIRNGNLNKKSIREGNETKPEKI
jgi:hypothetical protein